MDGNKLTLLDSYTPELYFATGLCNVAAMFCQHATILQHPNLRPNNTFIVLVTILDKIFTNLNTVIGNDIR